MKRHLAIFIGNIIEQILQGKKTVDVRFSVGKIPPYECVMKDDEIYLKKSGGMILGKVLVDNVLYYENINAEIVGKIKKEYQSDLEIDDKFWQSKSNSKYATIIFLKKPKRFLTPLKFSKHDRRPWVVLKK